MILTTIFKRLLARFNVRLVWAHRFPICDINLLDLAVPYLMLREGDFQFVQIGANDGIGDDPLRHLILAHGLNGLLVEPVPEFFSRLRENYKDQSQLKFANCAIATRDGTATLYRSVRLQNASLDKSCLLKLGLPESDILTESVTCCTFKTLVEKHQIQKISLLVTDCEGFDFEVIKMCFAAGLHPEAIHFESINLSRQSSAECRALLQSNGYKLVESNVDTLAVRFQV